jgi:Flp pilus assembly secretin CpaC
MRRPILTLLLASFGLAVTVGAAMAGQINVGLNEVRRIPLAGAAANVVVSDAKIADVSMFDAHSVIVTGRGYGVTGLLVADRAGHILLDSRVIVSPDDQGHVTYFGGDSVVSEYTCGSHCQMLPKAGALGGN